jgi:hypothetical protein
MLSFLLAALLPGLYWDQGAATADAMKQAGVEQFFVAPDQVSAWKAAGFEAQAFDPSRRVKLRAPGVQYRMDVATATSIPWVDANGWRFERQPDRRYYYDVPRGKAMLAAAEAHAYGADAVVHPDPQDLAAFGLMLRFLCKIDQPPLPAMANIGIIDDSSAQTGEVLNLLARRNLLFRVVPAPDPKLDLIVKIGDKEYPRSAAANPAAFSIMIRQKLTDEKRFVRLFGSDVVLARLTGDGARLRLYLINYSDRKVEGLRIRVRGEYPHGTLSALDVKSAELADYSAADGATEFTIPEMNVYAVIDLKK